MKTLFSKAELTNYFLITVACLLIALGVVGFFLPNNLLTGGTAGLSLLLHYVTDLTIGTLFVAINAPLLIIGWRYLGRMFAIKTICTIVIISLMIDFLTHVVALPAFVIDSALGSIFGGVFIGIGLALIIKANSSAGGSTIVARIIASQTEIKASTVILVIDSMIILSSLFVIDDVNNILWSVISIYITSKVIDFMLTGRLNKKVVYLVTSKTEELRVKIREDLGPHGTILNGDGLFEGESKEMILIVVDVTKLQYLRNLVKTHDPDGFLIISEASEMLGRDMA